MMVAVPSIIEPKVQHSAIFPKFAVGPLEEMPDTYGLQNCEAY